MKFFYLICFLSIFKIFSSIQLGGVKFGLSEQMVKSILFHFYSDINQRISYIPKEDINFERTIRVRDVSSVGISNFSLEKLKLTFTETGININITSLNAWINLTYYINDIQKFQAIKLYLQFNMDGNIYVTTKRDENNKLIPNAYFSEPPTVTINLKPINSDLENAIFQILRGIANNLLNMILDKAKNLPTIPIDEAKGLFIDCSLVNLFMKKDYLEVNSYALLFNKNMPETMQLKRLPISYLPSITSIDNPNQIFVSQYTINSALYTYFEANPLSLKINVEPSLLEVLLPTITTKLGFNLEFFLETTEPPSLNFGDDYVEGKIYGKIIVKAKKDIELIFACSLEINTKIEMIIMENSIITGRINELTFNIQKIEINKFSLTFKHEHMHELKPEFVSVLNQFISNYIKYTLPTCFSDISIKNENSYLAINYKLKIYDSFSNNYLINIQKLFKKLYLRRDTEFYKYIIGQINQEVSLIFKTYFPNIENVLTNQYECVKEASLKFPYNITDINMREIYINNLDKELTIYGRAFNIQNNTLSLIGSEIKKFMLTNINIWNAPEDIRNKYVDPALSGYIANIICLIEQFIINHLSTHKNYIILHDFNYPKCVNEWKSLK